MVSSSHPNVPKYLDKVEREARKTAAARHASSTDPERQKYITQQARERAQQRSERAKILKEIENDKLERKLRAGREHELHHHVDSPGGSQLETGRDTTKMGERGTTISVRLPDSRAIRTEFDSRQTLADVRKWIDETRNDPSSAPYVLQTTFPTRTFELSEEHNETLESLLGKGGQVIMKVCPYQNTLLQANGRKLKLTQMRIHKAPKV